jgi:hypothetical protein
MIIYGGSKEQVEKQLVCEHDWHGPCMDDKYRYCKCKKCYCTDRDIRECDEDGPGEHINEFVKGYFDVLRELEFARERRADALRIIEEKREEVYDLKRRVDELKKDSERLDWLQAMETTLYMAVHEEMHWTTEHPPRRETVRICDGWTTGISLEEKPTVREAIDAGMGGGSDE